MKVNTVALQFSIGGNDRQGEHGLVLFSRLSTWKYFRSTLSSRAPVSIARFARAGRIAFELADGQAAVARVPGWSIINWPLLNLEYPEKSAGAVGSAIYERAN